MSWRARCCWRRAAGVVRVAARVAVVRLAVGAGLGARAVLGVVLGERVRLVVRWSGCWILWVVLMGGGW